MPVDDQRQVLSPLGRDPPHMPSHRCRRVQALPSHHLRAPGQIAVFTKGEKVLIEKFAFHRYILDEVALEQHGSAAGAEDVLRAIILAAFNSMEMEGKIPPSPGGGSSP